MKKAIRIGLIIFLAGGISLVAAALVLNEGVPEGKEGPEADSLAMRMMRSLNYQSWQNTQWLKWSFPGGHEFIWDKQRGLVEVQWSGNLVLLNTNALKYSLAFEDGEPADSSDTNKLSEKAWTYFCNDSYWLVAPFKAFDPGTERRLVKEDGDSSLLVTYTSGGVTPGDSYLWLLDEKNKPYAYKMWVSIFPIGGVKAGWDDWKSCSNGLLLPKTHQLGPMSIDMGDPQAGSDFSAIGLKNDPFAPFLERLLKAD